MPPSGPAPIPPYQQNTPAPAPMQPMSSMPIPNSPKRKLSFKLLLKVAVLLTVLGGIAAGVLYAMSYLNSKPKTYTAADLITEQKFSLSYSRPKSWVDGSSVTAVKTEIDSFSGLDDYAAYTEGLIKEDEVTKANNVLLVVGSSATGSGMDDQTFSSYLADPSFKTAFEESLADTEPSQDELKKSYDCQEVKDYQQKTSYNTNGFQFHIRYDATCVFGADQQKEKGTSANHMIILLGMTDSHMSMFVLTANEESWVPNRTVYQKMASDFKAN